MLNILGGESSDVTPVSHAYSGGNVVFGTAPGKGGAVLETPIGNIPVYNNVRDGLAAGHRFNCGVVYLPPSAARDGVAELIRVNPDLRKIFIITEKISVHDAREIRAMGQQNGIDIFGANGLGVADSWNQVRIGGALGGDKPGDSLRPGSIAIFSNSGGFSTTIAQYLRMAGWGTTTVISSGKDVYIHYAAPEFAFALANDARSKAAVLYCEPGGYYELDAQFTKPVVACVVGRWKSKLTRAVGHAGAMAGGADDALAKERWFMEKFGVDAIFTPEKPVFSAKGALVTNIAHIPAALTAVMRANATLPDFAPEGNLALKPWFGSDEGLATCPRSCALPVVEALAPYNEQVALLNTQIGGVVPRQAMKDASGASQMDAKTQVSSLHGTSMLDAATLPLESNVALALLHDAGGENDRKLIAPAVAAYVNLHGRPELAAAQASREAGNAPNAVLAAAAAIVGPKPPGGGAQRAAVHDRALPCGRPGHGVRCLAERELRHRQRSTPSGQPGLTAEAPDPRAQRADRRRRRRAAAARCSCAGWRACPAIRPKLRCWRRSRRRWPGARCRASASRALTAESFPWWLQLFGTLIGASADASRHEPGASAASPSSELLGSASLGEIAFAALLGHLPGEGRPVRLPDAGRPAADQRPGRDLGAGRQGRGVGRRPGAARARAAQQGADRLSHAHRLRARRQRLRGHRLPERAVPGQRPDRPERPATTASTCRRSPRKAVEQYAQYKAQKKTVGSLDIAKLPGVNHPVFKDKPVNHDPREVFIAELFEERGETNVFHAFYRALVQQLFDAGVSRNVYCVNVDAVIAALLLKMLWKPLRRGEIGERDLETAAFTIFLYPRMLGCAAEIDDHLNRGRNMDTRTSASQCRFVA